jgi:hypothetical protein
MYIVIGMAATYVEMGRESHAHHHDELPPRWCFAPFMRVPAIAVRQAIFSKSPPTSRRPDVVAEPLVCCMNAHPVLARQKDTVAVIGAGPIGIMHARSRLQGAQKSSSLDNNPARLEWRALRSRCRRARAGRCGIARKCARHRRLRRRGDRAVSAAAAQNELRSPRKGVNFCGLPKSRPIAPDVNHIH